MDQLNDASLLQEYACNQSEDAFTALVSRHVDLVYCVALRLARTPDAADEVTQATFIILARKAPRLTSGVFLPGWLLRTARFAAAARLRAAQRRQHHEKEAQMESQLQHEDNQEPVWEELTPLLDVAVATLKETDRKAIVFRFYQNKSLKDVGTLLGIDEDAAQKRVARALGRLRRFFLRRGVTISATSLALLVSANAVKAAPVGTALGIAAAALAKGAASSGSALALIKSTLNLMKWAQVKATVVASAASCWSPAQPAWRSVHLLIPSSFQVDTI